MKKISVYTAIVAFIILYSSSIFSVFEHDIENIFDQIPKNAIYSLEIYDIKSKRAIFSKNKDVNLVPASSLKLIISFLAYDYLGKNFRYNTKFFTKNKVKSKILNGPVKLKFSGDPSLTKENIQQIFKDIKKHNIKEIKGNFWLDNSVFLNDNNAPGVVWDDLHICYGASPSAIVVNRNCFSGWLKHDNSKVMFKYDDPTLSLKIDDQVKLKNQHLKNKKMNCELSIHPSNLYEYKLDGCMSASSKALRMKFAIKKLDRMVENLVMEELINNDIKFTGKVIIGKPDMKIDNLLVNYQSKSLNKIVLELLLNSDNLYADNLLKSLGSFYFKEPGSFKNGVLAEYQILKKKGIDISSSQLVDGSGLSRINYVSASNLVKVLVYGWNKWNINAPWLNGAVKKGFWYKTGTMTGIRSVAGYLFLGKNRPIVFSIIINGLIEFEGQNESKSKVYRDFIKNLPQNLITALRNHKFKF